MKKRALAQGIQPGSPLVIMLVVKLIVLCALALGTTEAWWRVVGSRPQGSDLLAFARIRRAARYSSNAVVLLGSSRVVDDIDPLVLKAEIPEHEFFQLGINGQGPMPVLEDLAKDENFRGSVLCEFHQRYMLPDYPAESLKYLRFYNREQYGDFIDTWLSEQVKEHFAFTSINLWGFVAEKLRTSKPPEGVRREDRFFALHLRGRDNSRLQKKWLDMAATEGGFAAGPIGTRSGMYRIPGWVEAIRRRGGDVVFVQMPVSGPLRQMENEKFPNRDDVAGILSAHQINLISSASEPSLQAFVCLDGSHLDAADAVQFSASLARIVRARKLLPEAGTHRGSHGW